MNRHSNSGADMLIHDTAKHEFQYRHHKNRARNHFTRVSSTEWVIYLSETLAPARKVRLTVCRRQFLAASPSSNAKTPILKRLEVQKRGIFPSLAAVVDQER